MSGGHFDYEDQSDVRWVVSVERVLDDPDVQRRFPKIRFQLTRLKTKLDLLRDEYAAVVRLIDRDFSGDEPIKNDSEFDLVHGRALKKVIT